MADWSNLPTELIHPISQLLPSSIDLLRFRSVCAAWRAAAASPPPSTFARFPILPNLGISETGWGLYLSKRTIYSLKPSLANEPSWIIKLEPDFPARMHLLDPLVRSQTIPLPDPLVRPQFKPLPGNFPKVFNFFNTRVKELGVECVLQLINFRPTVKVYMEKVAFLSNSDGGFTILAIDVSGKLLVLRSGDEKWKLVDDRYSRYSAYNDVIVWEGKFYGVNRTGKLVLVNTVDLNVSVVAKSISGGHMKFLVDLDGELVLADTYLAPVGRVKNDIFNGYPYLAVGRINDIFGREENCYVSQRVVKFKVFKLDGNEGKWMEVSDLGNKMLFLGYNCTFSASNIEIFGDDKVKGNRIFFTDIDRERGGVGVFDMESGSIGPIGGQARYAKMFWPPPDWVYSTASIEGGMNGLNI